MTRAGTADEPVEPVDMAGLIGDALAVGPDRVRVRLARLTAAQLRAQILTEVEHRAVTLLREARGDRVRAAALNTDDWRRWHGC